MLLHITDLSNEPIHEQICNQLMQKILNGDLDSGTSLISAGTLAREHHVSKNTIKRAYRILEQKGFIESQKGYNYCIALLDDKKRNELTQHLKTNTDNQRSPNKNKYLNEELKMAREIQFDLLPKQLPQLETFTVAAFTQPSSGIGGDFYDCFQIDEEHFGFVIADASGHGLPAALIISQIQAIIKISLGRIESIENLMVLLNKHLKENTSAKNFVSLIYGIYNQKSGRFDFANAGHNMPILIRNYGTIEFLETTSPALGLTRDFDYTTKSVFLCPGDNLIFYTDGITETMDKNQIEYGEGRLTNLLMQNKSLNVLDKVNYIKEDIKKFNALSNPQDDQTVMILQRSFK